MPNIITLNKIVLLLAGVLLIPLLSDAHAANPNLYVSAENPLYNNHFAGSMVVEVVINDVTLHDTSEGEGEPNVTVNGKSLRMVQATDGKWYGYFANVDRAKAADQAAFESGVPGVGLDFGVFCGRNTSSLGPSFTQTDGIAVPRATTGATNGNSAFGTCTGTPSGANINNVVKFSKAINTNPNVPPGQIGLDSNAWPLIQLYAFSSNVVVQYHAAGVAQTVTLQYNDIPNISLSLDRSSYPPSSEVFVTIRDMQLNQDPTSRDSWTFNVNSTQAVFYGAFTENGADEANGNTGLINLIPKLSSIGFEKNGKLTMDLGSILHLKSNQLQAGSATDGTNTYSNIVTLVETQPNSGIFETADFTNNSNIGVLPSAPRGQSATIQYDSTSKSILSGLATAGISLGSSQVQSGQKIPVTVTDSNQNVNNGVRDVLEVFRSSAIIPSLTIGEPLTLRGASGVKFHLDSADDIPTTGTAVSSSVPDRNSARLVLDTRSLVGTVEFDKISVNLGVSSSRLQSLLINVNQDDLGTNWVNYDLRSLQNQLGVSDFSDTSISLFFSSDGSTVTLLSAGSVLQRGLAQISDSAVNQISSKSGPVFLVINFDASNNTVPATGKALSETDTQPIVFDVFSFGQKNGADVNNAIYRFELRETTSSSATFAGTVEYVIANQLNQFDPNLIRTLRTIDQDVKFFVNQRMIEERGVSITYSDLDSVGVVTGVTAKTDINTHTGSVSLGSNVIRFGSPVTIVLVDPDLNVNRNAIDIYNTINDPNSSHVDTVGDSGEMLLEVLINGVRYQRCTINGVEHGGLAATGFSMVETGPNTGRFEGSFKMPSQICNKAGTGLISPAGGIVDVRYNDFRDAFGQERIITLSRATPQQTTPTPPQTTPPVPTMPPAPIMGTRTFTLPSHGATTEIVLTGMIPNYREGTTIELLLTTQDGRTTKLDALTTAHGAYKTVLTLKDGSLTGRYLVDVTYQNSQVGKISFNVAPR